MRAALVLLAGLLAAGPAVAEDDDEVPPPEICWAKAPLQLKVRVTPRGSSHLAPQLPVEVTLFDGEFFITRWTEARIPESGPLVVRAIRVRDKKSDGWTLTVTGGVCNDSRSICLPYHLVTEVPARGRTRAKLIAEPGPLRRDEATPPRPLPSPGIAEGPEGGWYDAARSGDVDAAFAAAEATGRNVFIDFQATWCPPCRRLEAEFLDDPARAELLAGFVLLTADADHPSSFALKNRYEVGGYPTVLVVAPDGEELDRITGFDGRTDALAARLARHQTDAPEPLSEYDQLRADLDALRGGDDAVAYAEAHLAAAEAAPLPGLAAHHVGSATKALLESDPDRAAELRATYEERIAGVIGSRSPAEVVLGRGETSINGVLVLHDAGLHDDVGLGNWYRADWTADDDDGRAQRTLLLAEGALRVAAALLIDAGVADDLPRLDDGRASVALPDHLLTDAARQHLLEHQGRIHDLLSLLKKANLPEVAAPILAAMVELAPEEFTWHYKQAEFLRDHRNGAGAADAASRALQFSYGDNRLRAAKRLAELLHAAGDDEAALSTIDDALAVPPPAEEHVRTHRYRTALEELRAEIAGGEELPK